MKKLLPVILSVVMLASVAVRAQTNTNITVELPKPASEFLSFLLSSSNLMVAPYGIASTDFKKFGGGVAVGYRVSEFVVPFMRLDYYDKTVFMPSASLQLQAPIQIGGTNGVTIIPFAFGGLATPLGKQSNSANVSNSDVIGIAGLGAAIRLGKSFDIIGDYERWSGFKSDQIRLGFVYKF